MFENVITIFEMKKENNMVTNQELLLRDCHGILFPKKGVPSDEYEWNLFLRNPGDSDFGYINVEFYFDNKLTLPTKEYYSAFFSIRTDEGLTIKINNMPNVKKSSKISKDNKLALGISYSFKTEVERDALIKCDLFCIEGFISFGLKTNINGIMCRLTKKRMLLVHG